MTPWQQWQELIEPLESERQVIEYDMDYLMSAASDDPAIQLNHVLLRTKLQGRHRYLLYQIKDMKKARDRGENALLWKLSRD